MRLDFARRRGNVFLTLVAALVCADACGSDDKKSSGDDMQEYASDASGGTGATIMSWGAGAQSSGGVNSGGVAGGSAGVVSFGGSGGAVSAAGAGGTAGAAGR